MNKKLLFLPASLILAGTLALTGCGVGQTVNLDDAASAAPSPVSPEASGAIIDAIKAAGDAAKLAADTIEASKTVSV